MKRPYAGRLSTAPEALSRRPGPGAGTAAATVRSKGGEATRRQVVKHKVRAKDGHRLSETRPGPHVTQQTRPPGGAEGPSDGPGREPDAAVAAAAAPARSAKQLRKKRQREKRQDAGNAAPVRQMSPDRRAVYSALKGKAKKRQARSGD